jgi:hypothetical protein
MHELRRHLENIRAFTVLLWKLKAITEGFFIQVTARSEEFSKQIVGWENYLAAQGTPRKLTKMPKK